MANIGESHTTRLARERLEAIKKFIPVRDSVKQKLQLRQQVREGFAESAEELFKPVTKATQAATTAIVGKPDPEDPDKKQLSLLQAIEGLKKEQAKAVKGFNWRTDLLDNIVADIKAIPNNTPEEIRDFGIRAAAYYHEKETALKNSDQDVTKQKFLDGVYKLNRNIDRLDTKSEFYNAYMTGAIAYDAQKRKDKLDKGKKPARGKTVKFNPRAAIKAEEPTVTDPNPEEEKWEDVTTPTVSPTPELTLEELRQKRDELEPYLEELKKNAEELKKLGLRTKQNKDKYAAAVEERDKIQKEYNEIYNQIMTLKLQAKKKSGSRYTGGNYNICPDSVINDVSRLEVLIGGKRAGNNSREIINEAAGICQRLFQNRMIDSHIYRELIDELIDD